MQQKNKILQKLKKLKPTLKSKFGLLEMALFGSFAREDDNPDSDIDILIDLSKNTSSDFFSIAFQLQDYFYPSKVDVVTKRGIKPEYFESIKKDLIYV